MDTEQHGWQQLLNAQSEYITNLQRMLKTNHVPVVTEQAWVDDSPNISSSTRASELPMPAANSIASGDESAGGSAPRQQVVPASHQTGTPPMPTTTSQLLVTESCFNPAPRVPASEAQHVGVQPSPRADEVASEVLKLRLMKSQYEELQTQLDRASANLRRLPPQAIFQLRMYLERQLRIRDGVQEVLLILIECLCAICNIDLRGKTHEELLSAVRRLLRDPHHFTARLCEISNERLGMASARGRENQAKGLALFLLKGASYKRVREKEVNDCYDALHGWLHALYLFGQVSEKVEPISEELARQEDLLSDLATQERMAVAKGNTIQRHARVSAPGAQRATAAATRQSPLLKGTAVSGGLAVAQRVAVSSSSAGQNTSAARRSPSNNSVGRSQSPGLDSRSPSPPVPSYRGPAPRSPVPASSGRGTTGSTTSSTANRQAILNRTQSEKSLGRTLTGSPRATRASRSPSPGNTRPPVERQSSAGHPAMYDSRSMASRAEVRTTKGLSPSQSEKSLHRPAAQGQMHKSTAPKRGAVPQGTAPAAARPGPGAAATAALTGPTNRSSDPMRQRPGYWRSTGELRPEKTMPPTVGRNSTSSISNMVDQSPRSEASEGDADQNDFGPTRRRLPPKQYAALVRSAQQVERMRTR